MMLRNSIASWSAAACCGNCKRIPKGRWFWAVLAAGALSAMALGCATQEQAPANTEPAAPADKAKPEDKREPTSLPAEPTPAEQPERQLMQDKSTELPPPPTAEPAEPAPSLPPPQPTPALADPAVSPPVPEEAASTTTIETKSKKTTSGGAPKTDDVPKPDPVSADGDIPATRAKKEGKKMPDTGSGGSGTSTPGLQVEPVDF